MSNFPISISWQVQSPPTGQFNQLASAAQELDAALMSSGQKFDEFGQTIAQLESPLSSVGSSMGELSGNMSELEGSLGSAGSGMGDLASSTEELNGSIGETGGFIQEAAGGMGDLASGASESGGAMGELGGAIEETNTGFADLATGIEDTGTGFADLGTSVEETNTGFADLATGVEETTTGMTDLATGVEETGTTMEDLNTTTADTVTSFEDLTTGTEDSATGMEDFAVGTDDAAVAAGDLQSGIDPLNTGLETMGTGLGDAATAGDTFSGALGNMNAEIPGVTGGLTEANTLTGNLATGMGTTASKTEGATSSLGKLGIGMAAVIGTGVLMFNAFDRIGDAAVGVELAQGGVIRTQSRLEGQMINLAKKTDELNTKYAGQISGIAAWNAAMQRLDALFRAGITSGAEWDAALTALRAAQDNMNASTGAGQIFLDRLGQSIGTTQAAAVKLTGANLGLSNSQEAYNQAIAEMVTTIIPGMLGGFSGVFTALSGWRESTDLLRTAFGKLVPLFSAVVPVLAAMKAGFIAVTAAIAPVAIPVGIAIAAFAAFTAAVTAIRANIKVFDELGMKVGEVFPQMTGFLDQARQGFINLSDGLNTAISAMLGGIDQLTGGIGNLQAQWDGFTGTLPKGTGELGAAGLAFQLLGGNAEKSGEQVNVGAGKWRIADGNLVRMNGSLLATAGNFDVLRDGTATYFKEAEKVPAVTQETTTAMDAMGASFGAVGFVLKEQSANYSELTNAQKLSVAAGNTVIENLATEKQERATAVLEAQKYLAIIEGIIPAAGLSGAAIVGMADALSQETQAHFDAVREAAAYIQTKDAQFFTVTRTDDAILAYAASLKEEEKANKTATEETAKHVEELNKLHEALVQTGSELTFYADAANKAARVQLEFNTGLLEAQKAIQDETFALAKLAGELSNWNNLGQRAQAISNAVARGFLEQVQASQQLTISLANAVGKLGALTQEMGNSAQAAQRFALGLAEGANKALEWANSLDQARGDAVGFRSALLAVAADVGGAFDQAFSQSNEQVQRFIGVMKGVPSALQDVVSGIDEMGDAIVDRLKESGEEGKDAFMENIEKMEAELGQKFSEPLIRKLELETNIAKAEDGIKTALGVLAVSLRQNPLTMEFDNAAILGAIDVVNNAINAMPASAQAQFDPLRESMSQLAAIDFANAGIAELAPIMANILSAAENLGVPMTGLLQSFGQIPALSDLGAQSLATLNASLNQVGLSIDAAGQIFNTATGEMIGSISGLGTATGQAATETDSALLAVGASGEKARQRWASDMIIMLTAVEEFGRRAQVMAVTVSGAYSNMSNNTNASFNRMAQDILIVIAAFVKVGTSSQQMATTVSGSFSNMANNTRSSMNTMASGIMTIIASFTRLGSDAQRMSTTVGSAFTSMASRVTSSATSARTAITNLTTAVNTLSSSSGRLSSFGSAAASAFSRVQSSASSARSAVSSLQSAINSLRSKSITITVTTVYRTVFAAKGGAFIANSPMKIGPMHVSEFGQAELVSVHPLENPGGQTITGPGMQVSTSGPGAKAFAKSGDKSISLGDWGEGGQNPGDVEKNAKAFIDEIFKQIGTKTPQKKPTQTLLRELPIVIKIGDKTLLDIINRRLFEISDSIIT